MTVRRVPLPSAVHDERHLTVVSTCTASSRAAALIALLFCALLAGVPIVVLLGADTSAPTWIAMVVGGGLGLAGAAWVRREWRRQPPDTVVSDIGVLGEAASGWSNDIRWKDLQRHPDRPADVWISMSTRSEEALRWLHFFTSGADGQPAERKLRLLVPGTLGCFSYGNGFALRRAVLLQLATRAQPPLRFDPMLFVELGLHPRRWTPMPWPGRVLALLIGAPMVALFGGTFHLLDALPSVWWSIPILVGGMVAVVVAGLWLFGKLYPAFSGAPYTFTAPR
jgi:hypothetical protein